MIAQRKMKKTRRNLTVQRELKPCRYVRDLDFKRRWKMKQRDKTERVMRAETKVTAVMSKAELRTDDEFMKNMD